MSRKNHKMVNESLIKTDKSFSDLKLSLKERISDWLFEEYYSLFKSNGYKYSTITDRPRDGFGHWYVTGMTMEHALKAIQILNDTGAVKLR